MVARKYAPRLSRADIEAIARAHQFLHQAIQLLLTTNTNAAVAAIPLIGNADTTICALYNKAEKALLGDHSAESTESPEAMPPEPSSNADQEQRSNTPYSKPGEPQ